MKPIERVNRLCEELAIPVQFSWLDAPHQTFAKFLEIEEQILLHERERRQRP